MENIRQPLASKSNTNSTSTFQRTLGIGSLLAVSIGLVVSQGVMVLMLQGAGIAGLGFIIPLTLAYILALTYIYSFSELALMIPKAGGLASYTEVAIGHFPAILAVFSGYVVVTMFAVSAELLLVDYIINKIFPDIFPKYTIGFGLLITFTLLNLKGIDLFAKLQSVLAFVMISLLLFISLGAISGSMDTKPISFELLTMDWNPIGLEVITLVALAIWGFVGAEFVCPLVEDAKKPNKNIPRSMIVGMTVIFITISLYCFAALLYVPAEQLADSALPHYDFALAAFGNIGLILIAIISVTATCSTVNTCLAAIPRMLYGMALNGQVFPQLKKLSKKNQTPWVAVLFVAFITGIPMVLLVDQPESIGLLLVSAAIAWLISYIITHINVIVLRRRYPNLHRPYKTPFYPLPQIIGIIGMVYAIYYASPAPELSFQIFSSAGAVLGIVSVIAILWVKFVMKKGLFTPEPIENNKL